MHLYADEWCTDGRRFLIRKLEALVHLVSEFLVETWDASSDLSKYL